MNDKNSMRDIPRKSTISADEFVREHLAVSRPVILTGELSGWGAIGKWSLEKLQRFGDRDVQVEQYPSGNRSDAFNYVTMPLKEYLRIVRDDPEQRKQFYLAERAVESILSETDGTSEEAPKLQDLQPLSFLSDDEEVRRMVFVGVDTFSTAHYHRSKSQAVLCQVQGRKRLRMIPPSSLKNMYLLPWFSMRGNHSRIRFDGGVPDSVEYPKLAKAEMIEVVLEPGEALFIPDHWMHIVEGIEENISITYFWDSHWRHTYFPGLMRDKASAMAKSLMVGVASLSAMLGTNRLLVQCASLAGVVGKEDREAVLRHLDEFGAKRPHEQ